LALLELYGDATVLDEAAKVLGDVPQMAAVLAQLKQLASQVQGARVSFDLADLRGYAYYSGARFAIYVPGASDALVRGGRYDEVGAVFGRNRPAAGFSLDLRELVAVAPARALRAAIRAPWSDTPVLRQAIAQLRAQGETVVCVLPGAASEIDEFLCDRELVNLAGQWTVQPI
jgi:ATP phosphoribosyltransferase regulatory subunit